MIRIKREEGKELEISHKSQVKDCLEPPSLEESRKGSSLERAEEAQLCLRRETGGIISACLLGLRWGLRPGFRD